MAEIPAATKPSSDTEKPPPSAAARRMRRHRERRRRGLRHLSIELRACEIEAFIRRKRLSPEDRDNPKALRRMLYLYLDDTLWSRITLHKGSNRYASRDQQKRCRTKDGFRNAPNEESMT
jgi:hypothetical protein